MPRARIALAVAGAGLLLAGLIAMTASGAKLLDFQGHGLLLPGHGDVWRIRVAGLVTFYAPVFDVAWTDVTVSMLLVATGAVGGVVAATIRALAATSARSLWQFHGLVALAGIWLAADELFGGHETIGYAIENAFGAPPFFRKPDDAVFAAYGVVAAVLAWHFRDIALEPGVPRRLVISGLLLILALIVADVLGVAGEEYFEMILAAFVLVAYLLLARLHMARLLFGAAPPA